MNEINSQNLRRSAKFVNFMELRLARRGSNHQLALHLTFWSEFRECHSLNMSKEKIESLSTWWTDGKPYLRCPQTTEEALREESTDIWWEIWENGSRGRIFRLIFARRCDILWLMFLSSSLCQVIVVRCVSLSLSLTSEISGEVPWNPLKPPRRKIQFFCKKMTLPAEGGRFHTVRREIPVNEKGKYDGKIFTPRSLLACFSRDLLSVWSVSLVYVPSSGILLLLFKNEILAFTEYSPKEWVLVAKSSK